MARALARENIPDFDASFEAFSAEMVSSGGSQCLPMFEEILNSDLMAISTKAKVLMDLCWEKIHTGHWKDVPESWRNAYSLASWASVMATIDSSICDVTSESLGEHPQSLVKQHLHTLDLAIMMGGPTFRPLLDAAIVRIEHQICRNHVREKDVLPGAGGIEGNVGIQDEVKSDTAACQAASHRHSRVASDALVDARELKRQAVEQSAISLPPGSLSPLGSRPPVEDRISLEDFLTEFMMAEPSGYPIVITGAMDHWPAMSKWHDIEGYLIPAAGHRTVPVEVGSHYLADGWGQKLMTLEEFLRRHVVGDSSTQPFDPSSCGASSAHLRASMSGTKSSWGRHPGNAGAASSCQDLAKAPSVRGDAGAVQKKDGTAGRDDAQPGVDCGRRDREPSMQQSGPDSVCPDSDACAVGSVKQSVPCTHAEQHTLQRGGAQDLSAPTESVAFQNMDTAASQEASCSQRADRTEAKDAQEPRLKTSANPSDAPQSSMTAGPEPRGRGYLAQHPLFDQIPSLRADICMPEYCALGEGEIQSVNAWLGPAGTVSPLHYDPHHNLLSQVVGQKYVRLYAPEFSQQLHPFDEGLTTNSSQVDLEDPSLPLKYPGVSTLPFVDVVLRPGDMLYIPPKWWHFVKSMSISFSVSHWWK